MFSAEGAARVQQIVETAYDLAGQLTDDKLWRWCYSNLELLSRAGHPEAADTAVREEVWQWLVEQQWIDPQQVNYWFFVEALDATAGGESLFKQWAQIDD